MKPAGFTVTEILSCTDNIVTARASSPKNEQVLVKYYDNSRVEAEINAHWRYEYRLLEQFNSEYIVKPLALKEDLGKVILVMENMQAVTLASLCRDNNLNLAKRLKIACLLVSALTALHEEGLVHRNLNTDNILVDTEQMTVKIADLAKATRFKWQKARVDRGYLWGSAAYMSPELLSYGRIAVDYRSDFYSLGVILYQLFSGAKPFISDDFASLIQAQTLRTAEPLETLDAKIPEEVSKIVQKLLAKSVDDRYHNHQSLYADLKDCEKQWQTKGQIDHFTIGQNDLSHRFSLSSKIYGRDIEQTGLNAAFSRACSGKAELILIGGPAGIGKSSLVYRLHDAIVAKRGFFVTGRCGQYNRNEPYSALIAAFSSLMRQLLCEGEERLRYWRGKLKSALGKNTAVIAEIIPEVTRLTGEIPDLPELPPTETEKRFHITFGHFIKALSSSGHPLVIFIDNLQWADQASLNLLTHLTVSNEKNALLLIGAYRDDEVNHQHGLFNTIQDIELAQGRLRTLSLKPLARHHIQKMISDSFGCPMAEAASLSDEVYDSTEGNPFFAKQYLKTLYAHKMLYFDHKQNQWIWSLIEPPESLDIVKPIDLLTARLHRLGRETRHLLALAAFLGYRFSLGKLAMVNEQTLSATAETLQSALEQDFLVPLDENHQFLSDPDKLAEANYRFKHDLHQQAAYQLINDKDRPSLQLNIGRLLLKSTPMHELDNELFTLLEPFNHGRSLIHDAQEKSRLLAFNIRAGIMAKSASAFSAAVNFFEIAKSLLVSDAWALFPNQTLTVYKELAESHYLSGNYDRAEQLYEEGLAQAGDNLARLTLILVQSEHYQSQNRHQESIEVLNRGLSLLETPYWESESQAAAQLPSMIGELEHLLDSFDTQQILALPEMIRLEQLLGIELYFNLLEDLFITGQSARYGLCACQMVLLTLNHGQCDLSAIGFSAYMSVVARSREDHERCYQIGRLSIELADHRGNKYHRSSVYQTFAGRYLHWREPLQNAFAYLQQVIKWGHEGISLSDAANAVVQLNILKTIKGNQLLMVEANLRKGLDFVKQSGYKSAEGQILLGALQPVLALMGKTPNPLSFDTESVAIGNYIKNNDQNPSRELALYTHGMLRHSYLLNNRILLQQMINQVPLVEVYFSDSPLITECYFYAALALLGFAVPGEPKYVETIKQAKYYTEKIRIWALDCPQNYEHKHLILSAQLARISGDIPSATALFDRAIEASEQAGFIQCEALANELFATLWYHENQSRVAKTFIKEAHYLYRRWGAEAKCVQIEEQWPHVCFKYTEVHAHEFADPPQPLDGDSTDETVGAQLDIQTLFKANQQLAQEIQTEPLVKTLLTVVLEYTRAQYGAVIFDVDSQLMVELLGHYNPLECRVQCQSMNTTLAEVCAETPPKLPSAMIRYVQQTQEALVLKNPAQDVRFSHNEYMQQVNPKSVLLLPIVGQGRLLAIVYLENNLEQHELNRQHLEGLALLAQQAAVSLINATRFKALEEKSAKRKAQLNKEREKADRANETKSLFLANMSHEIRTPLTTVIGFAEGILFGDIEKKNHQQAIQTIANSGKHLLLLINDILDFSKIEAGQLHVEKIEVNLLELLVNLESVSQGMVKSKPIDFSIDLGLPLPNIISTDPTRLNQILLNLISNAVKFTESGAVTLKVFPKEDQLVMAVVDTGVGIKPEKISSLFFAFEQADKTVQRKYGGTGLGLTISKSLAQMLGGDILCESEFGKGSTFTITIELVTTDATELINTPDILEQTRAALDVAKQQSTSQLSGNILVAEDQPENLQLIITMLQKMGLTVTGVNNGQEAIEAFLIDDFDLILLDIQMPVMDGLETLEMLSTLNNDVPVIALTANAMKHEVEEYFRKGFDEHLSKPIERKPFVEKISRFLGQSSNNVDASLSTEEMQILQEQFSANLPAYLDRLTEHLRTQDWCSLQHDAHALKGAAGTLGFTKLSELAAHLEQDLKDNTLEPVPQEVQQLVECAHSQFINSRNH